MSVTIDGVLYENLGGGKHVNTTSTPDERITLDVYSTPSRNPAAFSNYRVVFTRNKNVAGAVTSEDDQVIIDLRIKTNARSFSDTDVSAAIQDCMFLLTDSTVGPANLQKLMLGVRDFSDS